MAVLLKLVTGDELTVEGDLTAVAREIVNAEHRLVKVRTDGGDLFVSPSAVATVGEAPNYGTASHS